MDHSVSIEKKRQTQEFSTTTLDINAAGGVCGACVSVGKVHKASQRTLALPFQNMTIELTRSTEA